MKAKKRLRFTFPPTLIQEPLIWSLGHQFNVVTNVRRANVTEDQGWVVLELEGEEEEIKRGIDWITAKGVRVDPVPGNALES